MFKVKLGIAAFTAMLVLGAAVSNAAFAATAGWMVKGAMLSGSKALATTAKTEGNIVLHSTAFVITCSGENVNMTNPSISSPSMGLAGLEFTKCEGAPPCTISGTTIKTVPLLLEATLDGESAVKAVFTPETKVTFATVEFNGPTCSLLGVQPITGSQEILAAQGQSEMTLQLFQAVGTTLKVGAAPAALLGRFLLKLASGEPWSFL
jgi:hypothetical protein